MHRNKLSFLLFVGMFCCSAKAQDSLNTSSGFLKHASGADSNYILTFTRPNDIRIILGGQGAAIGFQSIRDNSLKLDLETYTNASDLVGFGLTYKFIDFDLLASIDQAIFFSGDRQNLSQFKLSASYTARKYSFRAHYSESEGMISNDPVINYQSSPDIHLLKMGAQITHIVNSNRYSYRAANFQGELQTKTAASVLIRAEPFYRELGMSGSSISSPTRNVKQVFGDQAGLRYINSFGLVLMPGYAVNLVAKKGKYYTSPMFLLGPGLSYNNYLGETAKFTSYNLEIISALVLNSGYNGNRMYINLRGSADVCYTYFDPSIFSSTEIRVLVTVGFRFNHLENKIPTSVL